MTSPVHPRILGSIVVVALLTGSAALTLGLPDPARAAALLSGGYPTQASVLALVALVCWILLCCAALVVSISGVRAVRTLSTGTQHRTVRAVAVLVVGVILLGLAVMHRVTGGYRVCCADSSTVQEVERIGG